MKKILSMLLAFAMMFSLVGCSSGSSDDEGTDTYEIAMITDSGSVTDKSFNQSAYEGCKEFAEANKLTYKYYKPEQTDDAGLSACIENAIDNGAKVIVTPGFKFQAAVEASAAKFTDVKFIAIDFVPEGNLDNVIAYTFAEQEPGYMAGYAAVQEGYTKLGFMGGISLPAVQNYGIGYLQGANDAAEELGTKVEVEYTYTGTFNEDPKILTQATAWYKNGTEIIFSCGGQICNSIFKAAADEKAATIGVDSDQDGESDTVLCSALKDVKGSTMAGLQMYKDGTFKGGATLFDKAGKLSYKADHFENFTQEEYDALEAKIANGEIKLLSSADATEGDPTTVTLPNVTVVYTK